MLTIVRNRTICRGDILRAVLLGCATFLIAPVAVAELAYPTGTQDFESMAVGVNVDTLADWVIVNTSVPDSEFTVKAYDDSGPSVKLPSSTRWLRVVDTDSGDVQNRFYSGNIITPEDLDYTWIFHINLLGTPPGGGAGKPRLTIQHFDSGFANAWGIEFTNAGANLVVTGIGGTEASTPLYTLSSPTGVGDWVKLSLTAGLSDNTVRAAVNDGTPVSLPTNLSGTADKSNFRFCYRGEGTGNINDMLIDDVTVRVDTPGFVPSATTWAVIVAVLLLGSVAVVVLSRRRVVACPTP